MNIVSNSCIGAHLYKKFLKKQFNNPFMWTVVDFNSFLYLIEHWKEINFKDYELVRDDNWNFSIVIEGKIKIQFVHYKFDSNCKTPTLDKLGNILYYKIWEYIIEKYEERIERMKAENEDPIFCVCNFNTIYKDAIYTDEQLEKLSMYKNVRILNGCERLNIHEASKQFYSFLSNDINSSYETGNSI